MSADPRSHDPQRRRAGSRDSPDEPDELHDDEDAAAIIAGQESKCESNRQPRLQKPARGRRLVKPPDGAVSALNGPQRLLLLDTWRRSGLPAGDFAALAGMSK